MRLKYFIASALATVLLGVLVTNAMAHSRPIRFDPAPGAVLSTAPPKVDGWFTSEIRRDSNWSFMRVTDGQGNRVDMGETTLSSDRRQQSIALKPGLGPGRYVVTWRTFDDEDGAIFGDCYSFFVGQAAADAAVTDKFRLDAGSNCQRIDFEAKNATPTAAQASKQPSEDSGDEEGGGGDNGDIPIWGLVLGIVAGVVVGGVGGRFLGSRP